MILRSRYTYFSFISNTFIYNARLKLAKNQAKAKQHPETELLLFEDYCLSSSMLSSKNISMLSSKNNRFSKKSTKNKCVCLKEVT